MNTHPSLQEIINAVTATYNNTTVRTTASVSTPAPFENTVQNKVKQATEARRRYWKRQIANNKPH